LSQYLCFALSIAFTDSPYSSLSTCCFYQKGEQAKPGNRPGSVVCLVSRALDRKVHEHVFGLQALFHLGQQFRTLLVLQEVMQHETPRHCISETISGEEVSKFSPIVGRCSAFVALDTKDICSSPTQIDTPQSPRYASHDVSPF
jgi:hypothetical protein